MARPKEFDRYAAVKRAMSVFWSKGYAATSTDDLLDAMRIGRQSMYDTFGDKRRLYVEALARYQQEQVAGHIKRLRSPASPLAGVKALLTGVIAAQKTTREMGCMGVGAICEFGTGDSELAAMRATASRLLHKVLVEQIEAAKTPAKSLSARHRSCGPVCRTTMRGCRLRQGPAPAPPNFAPPLPSRSPDWPSTRD